MRLRARAFVRLCVCAFGMDAIDVDAADWLSKNAEVRLKRFKKAWHSLLDTEKIPASGRGSNPGPIAQHIAMGTDAFFGALRDYREVKGVALFLYQTVHIAIEDAAQLAKEAKKENMRLGAKRDVCGEGLHKQFHETLSRGEARIRRVCKAIVDGERSTEKTLHALPSDPSWPSAREKKRSAMKRELDALDDEGEDGFPVAPPRRCPQPLPPGAKLKKRLIDF